VGPEYIAIAITAVVSAVTGGSWTANRILDRQQERIEHAFKYTDNQRRRIDALEDQVNRMPMEYVLKVDFLREIKEMHDNFREINNKLDKLMEKLLSK
jgi:predicted RNase H-like nuclease (RuvC/YqgF family)